MREPIEYNERGLGVRLITETKTSKTSKIMAIFSFIDNEKKDFLRYKDGSVLMISCSTVIGAKHWLHVKGKEFDYNNASVKCFNWSKEFQAETNEIEP